MKTNWKTEWPSVMLVLLPFIYLAIIWSSLPESVPLHWNINGEIDRWGSKYTLLVIPFVLPFLTYIIFLLLQLFGSKTKLVKMGSKFYAIKLILVLFLSVIAIFVIHSSKEQSIGQPTFLMVSLGLLFAVLGNFFKTIQPNYFLGIRTPWTLRSETVWKSTHKLAGVLWFIGGLIIAVIAAVTTSELAIIIMISITVVITIIPVIYSYLEAQKLKND